MKVFKFLNFSFAAALIVMSLLGCYKFCEAEVKESNQIEENFKPKLDNIMLTIQTHHAKLYYAGEEENWELISFLLHELEEGFEDVEKYHSNHDGIDLEKLVGIMVLPVIEEMEHIVKNKNKEEFISNFNQLTNACNNCHTAATHSFIKIQTPKGGSFPNQDFTKK